jgi:hypothetical protein
MTKKTFHLINVGWLSVIKTMAMLCFRRSTPYVLDFSSSPSLPAVLAVRHVTKHAPPSQLWLPVETTCGYPNALHDDTAVNLLRHALSTGERYVVLRRYTVRVTGGTTSTDRTTHARARENTHPIAPTYDPAQKCNVICLTKLGTWFIYRPSRNFTYLNLAGGGRHPSGHRARPYFLPATWR